MFQCFGVSEKRCFGNTEPQATDLSAVLSAILSGEASA